MPPVTLCDSEPVMVGGGRYWRLSDDVRRTTLQQMGTRTALQAALAANSARPSTALQRMLEAYVAGTAPTLARQSRAELTATFQIAEWLEGRTE